MGNKMDHASASGSRDALDLSVADLADSPILDDQTVSDTLEIGAFHLSDHSTGDHQDDADKDAEDHGATSAIQVREPTRVSWTQRVLSWFRRD